MGHENGRIWKPVSWWDAAQTIGIISQDEGTICRSSQVNRWSLYKPIRKNTWGTLSLTDIQAAFCGLKATVLDKLLKKTYGYWTTATETKQQCIDQIIPWDYLQPRGFNQYIAGEGIVNEQCRAADFCAVPFETSTALGYNHNALPPDNGWASKQLTLAELNSLISASAIYTIQSYTSARTGKTYSVYSFNDIRTGIYSNFSARFSLDSGTRWGNTDLIEIPITWAAGGPANVNEDWRTALAVWIDNILASGGAWCLFPSPLRFADVFDPTTGTLKAGKSIAQLFPDFRLNKSALAKMIENNTHDYTAVPVLVNGLQWTQDSNGNIYPRVVQNVTEIWSVPSGSKEMTIKVVGTKAYKRFTLTSTSLTLKKKYTLTNTDTTDSHEYEYAIITRNRSEIISQSTTKVTIGPGAQFDWGGNEFPYDIYGINVEIEVTKQDGIDVEDLIDP